MDPGLESPYAPPRAGQRAGLWRAWFTLLRLTKLHESAIRPVSVALFTLARVGGATLGGIVVPSFGFYLLPNPLWRRVGPPLFWAALLIAVTEFTRPAGNLALGLAAAAHGVSAAASSSYYVRLPTLLGRIVHRFLVVFTAVLLVVFATRWTLSRHVVVLAGQHGPVLINPAATAAPPRAGERVAYRMTYRNLDGAVIREGVYTGHVLVAGPGREIVLAEGFFRVDGTAQKALPGMPGSGTLRTDDDHAFIWPDSSHFLNYGRATVPADVGLIPHSALVGRPYKRWFWHVQETAP